MFKIPFRFISLLSFAAGALPAFAAQPILVEAESFENHGGWKNDQQFMDQMGSPFLLAHGFAAPVADAVTSIEVASAGQYRVWVRTRGRRRTPRTRNAPTARRVFSNSW
jgi:hypothetical protein